MRGKSVGFADDCVGAPAEQAIAKMANGDVIVLENTRYHAGEEKNDPAFVAQMAAQPNPQRPVATAGAPTALDKAGTVEFRRLGNARWLHSTLPPEQLWPQIKGFWQDRGFSIETEDQNVGMMETSWAENRAKLPMDFIRKTVGSLLDSLYSTGERDRFRTRLERNEQGGTDIYVTHRGMVEVYTNTQKDDTAWQPRPADPQLEAEMMSRLMLKLGGKEDDAKAVAEAKPEAGGDSLKH